MSTFGNYIHLHKENYQRWGTSRSKTRPSESWSVVRKQFIDEINTANEIQSLMLEAKQLEIQYNNLFYNGKAPNNFQAALEEFVQNKLNQQFGLLAGKFNPNNLSVTVDNGQLRAQLERAIKKTKEKIGEIQIEKTITLKTFMNRLNKINSLLSQNEFKNIQAIQPRLKEAQQELDIIMKKTQQMIKESGGKIQLTRQNTDVQTIMKIIRDFNRTPTLYNQAGSLFEWILPFIIFQSSNLGKQELMKAMQTLQTKVKGEDYIKIEAPNLLDNQLTDIDIKMDNVQIRTQSVRSKTDVTIQYKNNKNQLVSKQVSAKNIKEKDLKLVESTTLYNVLLLSGNYRFANHYLNIITSSEEYGKSSLERILQANRMIKALIWKLSAEGYDLNNPSQLLIVNNKSESHIYVYNLKALIYIIQQNVLAGQKKYVDMIKNPSDTFTITQNRQEEGASSRINKIMQSIKNVKITGRLKSNGLDEYLNLLKSYRYS